MIRLLIEWIFDEVREESTEESENVLLLYYLEPPEFWVNERCRRYARHCFFLGMLRHDSRLWFNWISFRLGLLPRTLLQVSPELLQDWLKLGVVFFELLNKRSFPIMTSLHLCKIEHFPVSCSVSRLSTDFTTIPPSIERHEMLVKTLLSEELFSSSKIIWCKEAIEVISENNTAYLGPILRKIH